MVLVIGEATIQVRGSNLQGRVKVRAPDAVQRRARKSGLPDLRMTFADLG
jgi:hypothetical protein